MGYQLTEKDGKVKFFEFLKKIICKIVEKKYKDGKSRKHRKVLAHSVQVHVKEDKLKKTATVHGNLHFVWPI